MSGKGRVRMEWHFSILPVRIGRDKQVDRLVFTEEMEALIGKPDVKAYLKRQLENKNRVFAFLKDKKVVGLYVFETRDFSANGKHFASDRVEEQLYHKSLMRKYTELDLTEKWTLPVLTDTFSEDGLYGLIMRYYQMDDLFLMGLYADKTFYGCYQILQGFQGFFLMFIGFTLMLVSEYISVKSGIPMATGFLENLIAFVLAVLILYGYKTLIEKKIYKSM